MATIIQHSELVNRAVLFICERRLEKPDARVAVLLDEAGMRFNLGPADAAALERLVCRQMETGEKIDAAPNQYDSGTFSK